LEQKRKALSELEAQRQQRDKEMKHEAIETRNKIIEKAKKQKFEERDAVKAFNRALQNSEVLTSNDNRFLLPTYHLNENNILFYCLICNSILRYLKKEQFK
jgi:hypothetical protein